jgi:hypothetical protein
MSDKHEVTDLVPALVAVLLLIAAVAAIVAALAHLLYGIALIVIGLAALAYLLLFAEWPEDDEPEI